MESAIQEMAVVLRSSETMADRFAKAVQDRVGHPVPYTDILAAMKDMSAKTLSMKKVVIKVNRQLEREKKKAEQAQ